MYVCYIIYNSRMVVPISIIYILDSSQTTITEKHFKNLKSHEKISGKNTIDFTQYSHKDDIYTVYIKGCRKLC